MSINWHGMFSPNGDRQTAVRVFKGAERVRCSWQNGGGNVSCVVLHAMCACIRIHCVCFRRPRRRTVCIMVRSETVIKSRGVYELFRAAARYESSIKGLKEISMEYSILGTDQTSAKMVEYPMIPLR